MKSINALESPTLKRLGIFFAWYSGWKWIGFLDFFVVRRSPNLVVAYATTSCT